MKKLILAAGAAISIAAASTAASAAPARDYGGKLRCDSAGRVGFLLGSSGVVRCVFHRARGGEEVYSGKLTRYGIDVGVTGKATVTYAVYSTSWVRRGGLAGTFSGAHIQATAIAGVGAHALSGGPGHGIHLRPLSIETSVGIHVATGLVRMTLDYDGSHYVGHRMARGHHAARGHHKAARHHVMRHKKKHY